jgi:hypothetical protein
MDRLSASMVASSGSLAPDASVAPRSNRLPCASNSSFWGFRVLRGRECDYVVDLLWL